jgi:nucleoside-diphosphate-sugar epimerase
MSLLDAGPILVTGTAGFIGFHLAQRLLAEGFQVVGLDSINSYYDPRLKHARLDRLADKPNFVFRQLDLADREGIASLFAETKPVVVVNLAAQAGVRYSLTHPHAYVDSNISGFLNILEGCRHHGVRHLVYASSSSVYGANTKMPFSVHDNVDHPVSLYAATKKANELMAHTYSHLYGIPATGLRFFTVYGPWGRPDMAYFIFTKAIVEGRPIQIFNDGKMHLHRRHRRGRPPHHGQAPRRQPRLDRRRPRPRHQQGAARRLQHRQQPAGRADADDRDAGERAGTEGREGDAADAAGRHAGDLCRRGGSGARGGIQAGDDDRGGVGEVCAMVSAGVEWLRL